MGVLAEKTFFREEIQADLEYTCQVGHLMNYNTPAR
jgi:hypothetical protein